MKKIIQFLSAPVVNLIVGLLLFLWLGCCIWVYDSFDKSSAFYGGLFVIAIDIFGYGFNALVDSKRYNLKRKMQDDLCAKCDDRDTCPAVNTGVCYPCPHYKSNDQDLNV